KHTDVKAIEEQIAFWKSLYAQPGTNGQPTGAPAGQVAPNSAQSYITAMESEIQEDETLLKQLDDMFDKEQKNTKEISNYELKEDRLHNAVVQRRQLVDAIAKRSQELRLSKDFGGYDARQISPA